jgi:hypothetical protein
MNLSSSFSAWFEGDSASVFWAMIGGFAVAGGLTIEKMAEFFDNRFLGEYKAHKTLELFGWWILMFGIGIEIADAGWTAHEIKQAKQNEMAILNKTPGKIPVFSASAWAVFTIGTNIVSTNKMQVVTGWTATVRFFGTNGNNPNVGEPHLGLVSTELIWFGPREHLEIPIQFAWKQGVPWNDLSSPNEPADELIEQLQHFSISPVFLYENTEILGGELTLVLNGSVAKKFKIPRQIFFWGETNAHFEIDDSGKPTKVVKMEYQ